MLEISWKDLFGEKFFVENDESDAVGRPCDGRVVFGILS